MKGNGLFPEHYATMLAGSLSGNTKRAYLSDILDFFGVEELTDISIDMIQNVDVSTATQYRERLMSQGKKPSTVNRKLTSLSKFYSFLTRYEVGIMQYNPFSDKQGLARVKQNKRYSNTRCLTKEEVQKLVQITMENNDLEAVRNRIIVLLLATTGMRRTELNQIKVRDIVKNQGKDVIEIRGKGDKERLVVISGTVKVFIDRYLAMRGVSYSDVDAYLLVGHSKRFAKLEKEVPITDKAIYNMIKAVAEKAGIGADDISPHCLRHTFITEALDMGVKLEDVQDMVGHADLATTRRYDHTNRVLKNNPADALAEEFLKN
jgi:site-specific recombinase XerD